MGRTPFVMEFGAALVNVGAAGAGTYHLGLGPDSTGLTDANVVSSRRLAPVPLGFRFLIKRMRYFASAAPGGILIDTYRVMVNTAAVGPAAGMVVSAAEVTETAVVGAFVSPGDRVGVRVIIDGASLAADVTVILEGELLPG